MLFTLIATLLSELPQASPVAFAAMELTPGVYAMGSSHRFGGANLGLVICEDHVDLIGAPDPDLVSECLAQVAKVTEKPVRVAILTHLGPGEEKAARVLLQKGIDVVAQSDAAKVLRADENRASRGVDVPGSGHIRDFSARLELRDAWQ